MKPIYIGRGQSDMQLERPHCPSVRRGSNNHGLIVVKINGEGCGVPCRAMKPIKI